MRIRAGAISDGRPYRDRQLPCCSRVFRCNPSGQVPSHVSSGDVQMRYEPIQFLPLLGEWKKSAKLLNPFELFCHEAQVVFKVERENRLSGFRDFFWQIRRDVGIDAAHAPTLARKGQLT